MFVCDNCQLKVHNIKDAKIVRCIEKYWKESKYWKLRVNKKNPGQLLDMNQQIYMNFNYIIYVSFMSYECSFSTGT